MKLILIGLYVIGMWIFLSYGLGFLGALFLKSTLTACMYIMFCGFGVGYFMVQSTLYLWNKFI